MSQNTTYVPSPEDHSHEGGHVHGPGCNHHHHPAHDPYVRSEPKVGRNDPCLCGSGKKFKKCCGEST